MRDGDQGVDGVAESETPTMSETRPGTGTGWGRISTEVPALLAGVRVDRGVAMLANVSRAAAAELIEAGRVLVDGVPVSVGRTLLSEGAMLTVRLPERLDARGGGRARRALRGGARGRRWWRWWTSRRGSSCTRVRATTSGRWSGACWLAFPDLAELVASGVCPPDRPGIVHRLDKGTSGLLAVARTAEAYRALVDQLATRTMERRYLALVAGEVAEDRGEVEAPIGRSARTPTKMAVTAGGKPARTAYTVLERRGGGESHRRRCSSSPCRAGGPTRSASTWRPSGTPSWGMPATGCPTGASARAASSSTPSSSRSRTRARARD